MNVAFLPLFTLRVAHGFYAGPCRDVAFTIPAETAALLRRGRLLARESEGVLHVLFEARVGGAPLVPLAGVTFRIGMQLLNPYFGNITALPAGFPARRLRRTNAADPRALAPADDFAFIPDTFSHPLAQAARPATITLRDGTGTTIRLDTVTAGDGRTALPYDLRGRPAGPLSVEEIYPGPTTITTALYLDPDPRQRDVAGVVEITPEADFYTDPPAFTVDFAAREDVLSYYVVVDGYTTLELDSLSVTDQGHAEDGRDEVTFARIDTPGAGDLPNSLLAPDGGAVVVFRAGPLPRRERGRRRIQLSKNGDVLMPNLPQPGVERAGADLILHLSKP